MKLKAPVGLGSTVIGLAGILNADANGFINTTDPREIASLLEAGFTVQAPADKSYLAALSGIAPSATIGTYGTAQTILPGSGFSSVLPLSMDLVYSALGTETVTTQITVTYNDGTTHVDNTTFTATTNSTTALTNAQLRTLFANGKTIVSIAFQIKSSIASSTARLAVNSHGENL